MQTPPTPITSFKREFDSHLMRFATQESEHYTQYITNPLIRAIFDQTLKLLSHGGKRIRPYVTDTMYRALGGRQPGTITPILVAIELFHCFCLIHDDVMDRGTARHGIATMHCFMAEKMRQAKRIGNIDHAADAQAILAGDLLFALAYRTFHGASSISPVKHQIARAIFNRMVDEVIIGQMIDIDMTTQSQPILNDITTKMRLKTARYSFVGPMQIGLALAKGQDKRLMQFCEAFGTSLGLAFQVQDDLFDIITSTETSEKTILSDIAQRQHTIFTLYILEHGSKKHRDALQAVWDGTEMNQQEIVRLFTDSGALRYGQNMVATYVYEAKQQLKTARLPKNYEAEWLTFIDFIEGRLS